MEFESEIGDEVKFTSEDISSAARNARGFSAFIVVGNDESIQSFNCAMKPVVGLISVREKHSADVASQLSFLHNILYILPARVRLTPSSNPLPAGIKS